MNSLHKTSSEYKQPTSKLNDQMQATLHLLWKQFAGMLSVSIGTVNVLTAHQMDPRW